MDQLTKWWCLLAGLQREFPDPARGPGAAHPAAGQAAESGAAAAVVASRAIRQPVGGSLRKDRCASYNYTSPLGFGLLEPRAFENSCVRPVSMDVIVAS
ncbi:hypothetical protein PR048_010036 [Dryococelus australis]|uniref:Uncharacterized protein n=1 Tax=Dryococelus australis TaxID=614101 RepID=A0ABQ9I205_9NEOP|nr:hypothetical protein PR048_010036 [Dryococelus australis]